MNVERRSAGDDAAAQKIRECLLEDIQELYPKKGNPWQWKQPMIEHFLNEMRLKIKARLMNDDDLTRSLGLIPQMENKLYKWAGMNVTTFRNIFHYNQYRIQKKTLNKFAIFLGYTSGKDYELRRVLAARQNQPTDEEPLYGVKEGAIEEKPQHIAEMEGNTMEHPPENIREHASEETSKPNYRKYWLTGLAAAASVVIVGVAIYLFQSQKTPTGNSVDLKALLFREESELKILILPFFRYEGKESDLPSQIKENIDWSFPEDTFEDYALEVKVLDTQATQFSPREVREIGLNQKANMILWGTYKAFGKSRYDVNLYYTFLDPQFQEVSELSDQVQISGETPMNVGNVTGSVRQVVYVTLGQISAINGDWPAVRKYFEAAGYLEGEGNVGLYRYMGYAYYREGNYQKAYESLRIACKMDSTHKWSLNNLGSFCRMLGKFQEAETYLKKALELDPEYEKAYVNLGNVYNSQENYEGAIEEYNKALLLDPTDSFAYLNRGGAYTELEQYENALLDFEKYRLAAPEDADVHFNIGYLNYLQKNYKAAKYFFEKAHALYENSDPATDSMLNVVEQILKMSAENNEVPNNASAQANGGNL